jgi:hypothetical protein
MLSRTEHSERQSDKETALDWVRQRCPPIASSAGFIKTQTQRRVEQLPLLCASVPTTCIHCFTTINSTMNLGDSWAAWNAVAESGVFSQAVTLEEYYSVTEQLSGSIRMSLLPHCTPDI